MTIWFSSSLRRRRTWPWPSSSIPSGFWESLRQGFLLSDTLNRDYCCLVNEKFKQSIVAFDGNRQLLKGDLGKTYFWRTLYTAIIFFSECRIDRIALSNPLAITLTLLLGSAKFSWERGECLVCFRMMRLRIC